MSLKFKKISGSTPYLLNSASTAEELTLALEDYMRTGAQIIFQHDGEDCILTSFEYKTGIESTVIAYFVTPKKKLLKVDIGAGYDLVITESDIAPDIDITWENLQDKPFGEITENLGDTLTVDKSVLEGNIVTNTSGDLMKVSDAVPTIDDFANGFVVNLGENKLEATYEEVLEVYNQLGIVGYDFFFAIPSDNFTPQFDGAPTFPEKGFYIVVGVFDFGTTFSIKIPNYNFVNTTIKKIEEKYLPDTILIKSESVEIWVNDDGTIVNLTEEGPSQGMAPIFCGIVDEIPDPANMTPSDMENWNFYVVESTGIAYCALNGQLVTIGQLMYDPNSTDYDHGWTTDINTETEMGVYCVRTEKNVPTKEYVDNSIANAIGNAIGGSY